MGIEDVWDFITEKLGEAWDELVDLPSNLGEIFSGIFENLGEFSGAGLFFGIISVGIIYLFRNNVFKAFEAFPAGQRILWQGMIFIGCFVAGYLIGKRVFDLE